jgi:carbon-monoxide dehydrogenase large subunit
MTPLHETGTPVASVGRPVERVEDLRLLKGKGCYVDDVAGDDGLHAVILRSPVAHGLIRRIDTSAARKAQAKAASFPSAV